MKYTPDVDPDNDFLLEYAELQRVNLKLNEELADIEAETEELRTLVREFAESLIEHTRELGYTPKAFEHLPEKIHRSRQVIRGLHLIKKGTQP